MFSRIFRMEIKKTRWPLTVAILLVGPALASLLGSVSADATFSDMFRDSAMAYAWLFYPIIAGVFAALVCRVDHLAGGWKQLLSLPVRRWQVYLAKYLLVALLLAASQVLLLGMLAGRAALSGMDVAVSATIVRSLLAGWVAVLPLAALQLWASVRWRTFGGPLALNMVLTLPSIFAAQSATYGPWYPWAQPLLAMVTTAQKGLLNVSTTTLVVVIAGGFAVAMLGGLVSFARADIAG